MLGKGERLNRKIQGSRAKRPGKGDPAGNSWEDYKTVYNTGSKVTQVLVKCVTGTKKRLRLRFLGLWGCSKGKLI